MTNCISIDWLQLHVAVPRRDFENIFNPVQVERTGIGEGQFRIKRVATKELSETGIGEGQFTIKRVATKELSELDNRYMLLRTGIQTRNFKAIFEIKDRKTGEDIAVLAAEPRSEMCMRPDSGLLKIINKYLYQKNFSDFVRYLLKDLRLDFINITRIDIAYDFLKFDTMECQDFINRFAGQLYLKSFQSKMKMMGDSWSVDKGQVTGGISSLKFGLETSDVNYYLYNKTLELQQVKHKPWIHDHWKSNGWDETKNVWRLEFSLHPDTKGIQIVDPETFELKDIIHFKDLSMLDHIQEVYEYCFNKHFNFVRKERTKKGNYKKQSRCKKIVLFKLLKFEGVKISLSDKKDSGRSAKIFAKKLMEFNNEMRGRDFDLAIMGNEMFTWVIKMHDLEAWQKKKLPGSVLSNRVVDLVNNSRNARLQMDVAGINKLPSIYPSQKIQEQLLINCENEIKAKKFHIAPDGKIVNYDADGNINGYVNPIF